MRLSEDGPIGLITGGAGAIGSGIATALARDGWRLVLIDRDGESLAGVAARLGPAAAATYTADVCDEAAIRRIVDETATRFGRIDGLATAAGGGAAIGPRKPFWETGREDWRLNVETHLVSVMSACQAVLSHMTARKCGVILNVASGAGLRGGPPQSRQKNAQVYGLAKAGVIAFTQSIALEFASLGIRANCIAPGRAESRHKTAEDLLRLAPEEEAREAGSSRMSPLGRFGKAQDFGEAAAFLMSDRAGWITGTTLDVSGGVRLH